MQDDRAASLRSAGESAAELRSAGDALAAAAPSRDAVLVVEPSELARHRLRSALRSDDRQVVLAAGGAEGLHLAESVRPALVLVSLGLPDLQGPRAIEIFRQKTGALAIAIAEQPTVAVAVEAVRRGASDVIGAHEDPARIRDAVDRALRTATPASRAIPGQPPPAEGDEAPDRFRAPAVPPAVLRGDDAFGFGFNQLLTQSPRMLKVFDDIRLVARTDATALILGETGTGKELVSRAIHERSRRKDKPLISVNCGAFTETLLESELFGHEKGSFTGAVGRQQGVFEMADGGSLFLDELGETSQNVQVNLLRVLEEMAFRRVGGRELVHVDVRIVAATNVHLERAVQEGRFRKDLFYRLSVFPIRLPPLRERREDIPLLMRHFLDELAAGYELEPPSIAPEAMRAILGYGWPGNVRQLRAMCERWVIVRAGQRLERDHLPPDMLDGKGALPAEPGALQVDPAIPLKENLDRATEEIERTYLHRVLQRTGGHLGRTADAAGITRRTLYTKMKQYGLQQADYRPEKPH